MWEHTLSGNTYTTLRPLLKYDLCKKNTFIELMLSKRVASYNLISQISFELMIVDFFFVL